MKFSIKKFNDGFTLQRSCALYHADFNFSLIIRLVASSIPVYVKEHLEDAEDAKKILGMFFLILQTLASYVKHSQRPKSSNMRNPRTERSMFLKEREFI